MLPSNAFLPTQNGLGTSCQLPIQVILSTTPNHVASKDSDSKEAIRKNISTQTIAVRPMSKKDIFYSGSTLHIPSSVTQLAESGVNIGQSIVSIPARDIIAKIQKQIQKQENDDEEDGGNVKKPCQKKNVCDKILQVLCSFKEDCCHQNASSNANNNDLEFGDCDESNKLKPAAEMEDNVDEEEPRSLWNRFIGKLPPSMGSILNEMLDFSLLRESKSFTLLAISNVFGMMGFYVPFVYITQFAISSVKSKLNANRIERQ